MKKTMGKIIVLSLFAVLSFLFCKFYSLNVFAENPYQAPTLNGDNFYEISSKDELYWFAYEVNNNKHFTYNAKLMNDITINSSDLSATVDKSGLEKWSPIGDVVKNNATYQGTFDGNHHKVSGIYVSNTTKYIGFFGDLKKATVKDLTLENIYYETSVSSIIYIGGLAGKVDSKTTISNISVAGALYTPSNYAIHMGGIVGYCYGSNITISSCISNVDMDIASNKESHVGGIIGYTYGGIIENSNAYHNINIKNSTYKHYVAGIAAYASKSTIRDCINMGNIDATYCNTSGIVGRLMTSGTVMNCKNYGEVKGRNAGGIACRNAYGVVADSINYGEMIGEYYAGGIVAGTTSRTARIESSINYGVCHAGQYSAGVLAYSSIESSVSYCQNYADIYGGEIAAGISGYTNSNVLACENYGHIYGATLSVSGIAGYAKSIRYSFNQGMLDATDDAATITGIAYRADLISNAYNIGEITKKDNQTAFAICADKDVYTIIYNAYYTNSNIPSANLKIPGSYAKLVKDIDFLDGSICYELNDEPYYKQTLGVDSYPTIIGDSKMVYRICDGATVGYSNTMGSEEHHFVNGICSCGEYEIPEVSLDGTYLIKNAGNLLYFAEEVNKGNNTINGKLISNIVLNNDILDRLSINAFTLTSMNKSNIVRFTPIGSLEYPYNGKFDGNYYSISGLFMDDYQGMSSLFGVIGTKGLVKNLSVKESCIIIDETKIVDRIGYYTGFIYGDSVGLVDNVSVSSSYIAIKDNLKTIIVEHNHVEPLMHLYYGGNFVASYVQHVHDRYIGYSKKLTQEMYLTIYYEGTGVLTSGIPEIDYSAKSHRIDGAISTQWFFIQDIYVGEGITELGENCFEQITPYHLYLPSTLKKLNYLSITGCSNGIIVIPRSVERIEEYAIYATGATVILPNTIEYLDSRWIASVGNVYFEGTKDEYIALGQTVWSYYTYVFGYNKETSITGAVNVTLEYTGTVNPYAGNYLQLTCDGKSKLIPITNTTKFTFQGCTSNKISYLEIVSGLGTVLKDLGSFVLNEENNYSYSEKVTIVESVPKITVTLYDENNSILTSGYRVDLYKGNGVIDSNWVSGESCVFTGIEKGTYDIHIVFDDEFTKKYKAVEDISITLEASDINKSIQLSLIKEKTVTFTVIDEEEELPIENVVITLDEAYSSSIHKFYTGVTDQDGKVTFNVHNIPIEYTVTKEGYFPEVDILSDATTKVTINPSLINGIPVRLNVLAKAGNGLIHSITDIDSKNLSIYNNTTKEYIIDYYLYDNKVYLPVSMASYSDSLTFTISGIKNMGSASEEIILKEYAMVNLTLEENSYFSFTNVFAYVHIFDSANHLVDSFNTKKQKASSHLPHGDYKILLIDDELGSHIKSLDELSKYPFVLNQDYYLINKTLSDSVVEIKDYSVSSNLSYVTNNIINLQNSGTLLRANGLCVGEFQTVRILLESTKSFNGKLEIVIPKECSFQNGSLRVDNKEHEYTIEDGCVLLDITDKDSVIKYSICANQEANNIEVKARILYNDTFYPIPSAYFQTYLLKYTIDTNQDRDTTLNVAGLTIAMATVELYDNDILIGKTLSDSMGAFSIKENIEKRRELHEIYLKVIKDGKVITISERKDVNLSYFKVSSMILCHNGRRDKVGYDKVSTFSFNPKNPKIGFEVVLGDNQVDAVELILKLNNGETKTLTLEYNSQKDIWYKEEEFSSSGLPSHISLRINDGMTSTYQALSYGDLKFEKAKSNNSQTLDKDTFSVTSIGPTLVSAGEVTFRVNGTMLSKAVDFEAVADGARLKPIKEYYVSLEEVYVTFDFSGVKSGDYYLHATYNGYFIDKNFTLDESLTFGYVGYTLNVPSYSTLNEIQTGSIYLENSGYTDSPTKVVVLSGEDIVFEKSGKKDLIDIISCDGLAGTLLAKEDATYYFKYRVSGPNPKITCCFLDRVNERLFDSPDISQVGKNSVRENVYSIIGNDSTSYQKAISEMANYLSTIGYKAVSIEDCEKAIVAKAKGFYGTEALFVDSIITEPHFDLYRIYNCTTERHLEEGIFGRGIFTNFEITLKKENDVYIMYLPEERIYFNEYLGKYYSYDGRYTLTISSTSGTIVSDDTKYIFDNGLLMQVISKGVVLYNLSYTNNKLTSIQGLYDLVTFHYKNGYVDEVYLNGSLKETYIQSNGFLMGVRGNVNYNYNYLFNEVGARYGLMSSSEINDEVTTYDYDSLARLTKVNKGIYSVSYEYLDGLVVKMEASGSETYLYFDSYGNIIKEISSLGMIKDKKQEGNLVYNIINTQTQASGYDEYGRINVFNYADGTSIWYTYSDTETKVKDAKGNEYIYRYDENKTLIGITYPDNTKEEYTYSNGFLVAKKDRKGLTTSYTYDTLGRVSKITYPDSSYTEYEYNSDSSIKSLKDSTYTMAFTYTKDGLLDTLTYKDGKTLHYEYDEKNRVAEVTDPLGRITRYEYDENDLISKVKNSSNSVITEYIYDSYGRVIKQKNSNSSYTEYTYKGNYIESVMNYGKNKELLSGFVYTYNLYGLVERIDTLDDRIFYYYDSVGRITKIMSNNMNVTYVYDALGNRRSMVVDSIKTEYSSNELNQYITIGNNNLSYDLNGNLISISGSETYNFTYNAKNQLVSVENGTDTFTYTYDFFGNRDSVTVNGTTTNYYYTPCENGSLVASKTGSKGISYIYGNSLIGAYTNSKMYYYDYDGIGNVCEIVNSSGVVQNSYTYDGNYTVATKTEAIANPFTYGAKLKYMDDGSILYKVGKRYILKDTLVFTSPEQNGVELGINLYQYAGSNHINLLDKGGDIGVIATACLVGVGLGFAGQLVSDTINGQVSYAGDYVGSMVSGALTGAAGAVVTLSGGAGLAFGAGLNAAGSVVGTYVSAFVDYGLYGRDFKWDELSEKAYSNAEWAAVSGIFGGLLGKATGFENLSGLVTDASLGKIRAMLEAEGYSPEEIDEMLGFRLMPLIDPSGYVCEGVASNRIEGVKCTLYYSEVSTGQGAVVYSNEYWGQINPLYSDSEGKYAWDVPQGYWQVKFEKEGYFVAYSEWLPVPPIQLDVNVSLVAIDAPMVESIEMKKNEIIFKFTQYMYVDDMNSTNIKVTSNGNTISGTFVALDSEESFNDSNIMLGKTFKFVPNKDFDSLTKIEISNVLNYTDTPIKESYTSSYDFSPSNPINPNPNIDPENPNNPENPGEEASSNQNSAGLPVGAVIGISIGAVLLVAASVVVVIIVIKKKKSSVRE